MANTDDAGQTPYKMQEPQELADNMTKVMDALAALAQQFADANREAGDKPDGLQPFQQIAKTFNAVSEDYMKHPDRFMQAQMELWQSHSQLWQNAWQRFLGEDVEPVVTAEPGDRRFRDDDWQENQVFDFLKQSYLITAKWAQGLVEGAEDLDDHTRKKANFYVDQIANALSPTNFALTNPEVLKLTLATERQEPCRGTGKSRRGYSRRQRQPQDPADRLRRVRGRQEHGPDTRQGRLPERPDATHPV